MLKESVVQAPAVQEPWIMRMMDDPKEKKPVHFEPSWWRDENLGTSYAGSCRAVIRDFVQGKLTATRKAYAMNGRHIYSTRKDGTELWLRKDNPSVKVNVCVAKRVNGAFIGNSSSFFFFKKPKSGKIQAIGSSRPLKIQEVCQEVMPLVPFATFKENQFDLDCFTLVDRGPEEQLDLGLKEGPRHFTGAMLFKIEFRRRSKGLRGDSEYFLFDIDRNDLKLKHMNPFISKLRRPAKSIADAYLSLKPKEVHEAERFLGHEVQRQGEWFFIPVQGEFEKAREIGWSGGRPRDMEATLQSKGNRAHYAEKLSKEGYVRGKVTHGGHEHKPIFLDIWHKAVPNSAVESFTITGGID